MMLPLVNSSEEGDMENEDRLGRGRSTSGYTTDEEETEDRFRATSLARSFSPSSSFSSPSSIVSIPLKVLSPIRHQHGKPFETEDEEDVSVSVSPPSSSSSSTQLDQEEEIRHLWTMDKWRWWPKRIRAHYRFYPWPLGLRRFFAHGWTLFFFPVILLLILLLMYLVPAQTTLVSTLPLIVRLRSSSC
jgi:hypothetical protein